MRRAGIEWLCWNRRHAGARTERHVRYCGEAGSRSAAELCVWAGQAQRAKVGERAGMRADLRAHTRTVLATIVNADAMKDIRGIVSGTARPHARQGTRRSVWRALCCPTVLPPTVLCPTQCTLVCVLSCTRRYDRASSREGRGREAQSGRRARTTALKVSRREAHRRCQEHLLF